MTDAREPGRTGWGALLRARWPYVVGVLGLVAGLVMALVLPAVAGDGWSKDAKAAEAAASEFVTTYNTYDPTSLDDYRTRIAGLVTDEFDEVFTDSLDASEQSIIDAQLSFGGVSVTSVGATQVTDDTVNVVVVFQFTATSPSTQPITVGGRVILELTRSGDAWLVSDLSEIQSVQAGSGAPADGSTPVPTPEVTP
ncbi:hypothetical protein [Aeromicrobium sp. Leaf350]|uniref:hypothetical protein n=1 Tax=Aeromicrobium sp. Leaf350 TaxID=2876565 RepID=UPI001E4F7F13|nr:hypothetical protein [Aeromicrobium sp. Leaf350]